MSHAHLITTWLVYLHQILPLTQFLNMQGWAESGDVLL